MLKGILIVAAIYVGAGLCLVLFTELKAKAR